MEWLNFVVNNPVFVALAETLLHFAWQGLLFASLLLFLLKSIHNRYSVLRYNLSLIILVLCVVAPVTTFSIVYDPYMEPSVVDVKDTISQVSTSVAQVGAAIAAWSDPNQVLWSITATELLDSMGQWQFEMVSPFLAIAWMAGVVLMSGRLVIQLINVYQLPHRGISSPDAPLQDTFERLMEQLGVSLVARLLISSKVDVPMVIGWLKPVVLLPSAMVVGLTPKQLEMLLAHELAHVRRHDYLVNFLQTMVEVMLFFHPGVKWISRQIRTERECCCDDVAIAHCGSPVAYASALTEAEMSRYSNIPKLAMAASGSDLKHRVFRVVGQADCSSGFNGHWVSGLLAALSSVSIVFFMFSADVIGMTSHSEKSDKNESFLVMVEAPTSVVEPTPVAEEKAPLTTAPLVTVGPPESQAEVPTFDEQNSAIPPEPSISEAFIPEIPDAAKPEVTESTETPEPQVTEPVPDTGSQVSSEIPSLKSAVEASLTVTASPVSEKEEFEDVIEAVVPLNTSEKHNVETSVVSKDQTTTAPQTPKVAVVQQVAEIESILIKEPVLLRSSTPDYPAQALKRKWSEEVLVRFVVNESGRVEQIKFENQVHRVFQNSVKKALRKWQFEPAVKDGEVISMEVSKLFSFSKPVRNAITGTRIARL